MGVEHIFASPGSDWSALWEALARPYGPDEIPSYTSSRHEITAVAMATGYAKATGKLPAVILHTTVGALNGSMAFRAALHERIPMVILAGESISFGDPPGVDAGRQWLRLLADVGGPARLVEGTVKWSFAVNAPSILSASIARACQLAMDAPRGPVFLSIPTETLLAPALGAAPAMAALPTRPAADPGALDALASELVAARNPLLVTEELGRDQEAVGQLVRLAEVLGAAAVDAWHCDYINFPREHPLYGGVAVEEMKTLVGESDLVVLVEAVAPWHPASSLPGPDTRVVTIGESPLHPHIPVWNFRADRVIPGVAGAALGALADRVSGRVSTSVREARAARWHERNEAHRRAIETDYRATGQRASIDTRWVAYELNAIIPPDAIVVNETITHRIPILRGLDRLGPGSYYDSSYGGLGMGLGTALGVKAAAPNRLIITMIGDGAFHYNPVVACFGASQELRLPILVVLFNNAGYLSQKGDVVHEYPEGHAVRTRQFAGTSITPRPDYSLLAQAYGGYGERVASPQAVRGALQRGLEATAGGRLALIDIVLDPVNPTVQS